MGSDIARKGGVTAMSMEKPTCFVLEVIVEVIERIQCGGP